MKKTLIYCTNEFPGDLYSEKAFVDSELPALRRRFSRIILMPCDRTTRDKGYESMLPEGVEADWSLMEDRLNHSRLLKISYIFHPFVIRSLWTMIGEARTPAQWIKGLFQAINTVTIGRVVRKTARKAGLTPRNTVLYSLWFHNSGAALARLASIEGWHMATRAHTSDIYDEQMVFRSRRIRKRLLKSVDNVFTISTRGLEYLKERFPEHAEKFLYIPLGSMRAFTPEKPGHNSVTAGKSVSFMTVARLDPIKRLDLIMDVLAETAALNPAVKIVWTIIGDGECMPALVAKADGLRCPNLGIRFEGALDNMEIQRRYACEAPDWFVMMSSSEGIPISMGEAMSYGIPVITTDVGSVGELATPECAVMLPRDIDIAETARRLSGIIYDSSLRERMGQAALSRWEEMFDSTSLSERLAVTLDTYI